MEIPIASSRGIPKTDERKLQLVPHVMHGCMFNFPRLQSQSQFSYYRFLSLFGLFLGGGVHMCNGILKFGISTQFSSLLTLSFT